MYKEPNIRKQKINLISLTKEQLKGFIKNSGISENIAQNIYKDIHKRHIDNIDEFSVANKWKYALNELAYMPRIYMKERLRSNDGNTTKYIFQLDDGEMIESVLLSIGEKLTLCISSQVGCALRCTFCATGVMGFKRNLESWEILSQVYNISSDNNKTINNIVYMGMGEPMLNYENVISSAHTLNDNDGMNIANQKISISTVGISEMMKRFINDKEPFHLILSLHSIIQSKREQIMPIARKYNIKELLNIVKMYYEERRDWITIAYIMIKDLNIGKEDSDGLIRELKDLKVKLNLIPYNEIDRISYETPSINEMEQFKKSLLGLDLPVNIRKTQGKDIKGACGQLIIENTIT